MQSRFLDFHSHQRLAFIVIAGVLAFGAMLLMPKPAGAQAQFPLIGTTNTSFATGSPKDRHMVFFDNIIIDGYLENYDNAVQGGEVQAFAGQLKFRKSLDGYTWTEALSNPATYPIFGSRNFSVARDMTAGTDCSPESECNIYVVYFDSVSRWTNCGGFIPNSPLGSGGEVWLVELSYKQSTGLWEMQAPVKVTDASKYFTESVSGKNIYYDRYSSMTITHPGSVSGCAGPLEVGNPVAEPKPVVWVEGSTAWVLYDLRVKDEDETPTTNGADYVYLRLKRFTKSGSVWLYVANSERDVGYIRNCTTAEQSQESGAYDEDIAEGFGFNPVGNSSRSSNNPVYATLARNPYDGKFNVFFNVPKLNGTCDYGAPSTYEPLWPSSGYVNQLSLSYIAINDDNFSCGHVPGSVLAPSCTLGQLDALNDVYPGKYFSVAPTQDNPGTGGINEAWLRVVYPLRDPIGAGVLKVRQAMIKDSATKSRRWMEEFANQDAFSPVISGEASRYWIITERDPLGASTDTDIIYRKYDPSDSPIYPVDAGGLPIQGQINVSGTVDKNPTAPYAVPVWGSTYLTSIGHPAVSWVNNKASVFYPEGVENGVRINGWAWTPTIGWISLDYLNMGNLGDRRYGGFICQINTGTVCPNAGTSNGRVVHGQMWSPNVGWISMDYNAATQCGGVGKARNTWTQNGVRINATASTDPAVSYNTRPKAVADLIGNGFVTVWQRNDTVNGINIYMQRHSNATGVSTAGADKVVVNAAGTQSDPQIVVANDGNFIIAWSDNRNGNYDIYAHKININGDELAGWAANGNQVSDIGQSNHQLAPQLVADNAGGAYVIWSDERGGAGAGDIYIQRMASNGTRAWAADVAVVTQPNKQDQYKLAYMNDGAALVVWTDCRATDNPGACPGGSTLSDIYYQKVTSAGTVQYAANGLLLTDDAGGNATHGYSPFIVSSINSAIVVHGRRGWAEKNLHKIDNATGNVLWDKEVNTHTQFSTENYTDAVPDGSQGMIFTWYQSNVTDNASDEVFVKRIDQNGSLLWDNSEGRGLRLTDTGGASVTPKLHKDLGTISVRVAWLDARSGAYQVYVQKVTNGAIDWDANGLRVMNLTGTPPFGTGAGNLSIIRGPADGKSIVIWTDERAGVTGDGQNNDVYAQLVETTVPITCGTPPAAISPALPAGVLSRFNPENNTLEGWARILSVKDEGERIDGSYLDGVVDTDCYPSQAGVNACDWGWMRFGGTWSLLATTLTQPFGPPSTIASVVSTAGWPTVGLVTVETNPPPPPPQIDEDDALTYSSKTATTLTFTSAPFVSHVAGNIVTPFPNTGSYSVGAHYLDDLGAYQLFDFAFSPSIGWVQFLPFRFIGFPFAQTKAGNVYSGQNITLPAPPPDLESVGEFTSTYLIQADGTISKTVDFGLRSSKGATSGSGTPALEYQDPEVVQENQGLGLGFPGIGSAYGDYANALGKVDVARLTEILDNCKTIAGVARDCADMKGDGAATTEDYINNPVCFEPGASSTCANDGSGTNIFGTEVVVRHTSWRTFENYSAANHPLFAGTDWYLGGKIWHYPNSDLLFQTQNHTFRNAVSGSGAGIIIAKSVEFRDVSLLSGITYESTKPDNVKKLASALWILSDDVKIDPGISALAGSFLVGVDNPAEGTFDTCTSSDADICQASALTVNGIVIARKFNFDRTYYGSTQDVITSYAERIINDGRLLANPPPGIEDFSQALPRFYQVKP